MVISRDGRKASHNVTGPDFTIFFSPAVIKQMPRLLSEYTVHYGTGFDISCDCVITTMLQTVAKAVKQLQMWLCASGCVCRC